MEQVPEIDVELRGELPFLDLRSHASPPSLDCLDAKPIRAALAEGRAEMFRHHAPVALRSGEL
jgi:hypothetical protein